MTDPEFYDAGKVDELLAGKQDKLSQSQLAAVNSGATKEKIDAIDNKLDKTEGVLEAGSFGLADGSGVDGFFVREDGGIYIGTPTGIIEIPGGTMGGTMAVTSDIPDVIDPAIAMTTGKAADAKKVAEALAGKLDSVSSTVVLGGIGFGNDAVGYFYKKDDVTPFATNVYGNIFSFPATNKGNGVLALTSDIAAATKLTPVRDSSGETVGYKLGAKTAEDDPTLNGMTAAQITTLAEAAVENKITTEDASLVALIKKYGGTKIKEDEKGFYYEVEEEA